MIERGMAAPGPQCDGCTKCCESQMIPRHPIEDFGSPLEWVPMEPTPLFGLTVSATLARKADGTCRYLSAGGCQVYNDRPFVCRQFDCAALWLFRDSLRSQGVVIEPGLASAAEYQARIRGLAA